MASVVLYFQIHQPYRLRRYTVFDTDRRYFDDTANCEVLRKIAHRCYVPANRMLLEAIRAHEGRFRIALSVTGVALEQFEAFAPEVLEGLQKLAETGSVEFLDETYYHSLAFLYSREEFAEQVRLHRAAIAKHFGQEPKAFRNTELIYNNDLAHYVGQMGYRTILTEGADHILGSFSPNRVFTPPHADIRLLLKNYQLSDDISLRFSNREWAQWPLTAEKFAGWVGQIHGHGDICNLFLDYETLGEHHWADSGIFDFFRYLPARILERGDTDFLTPSQAAERYAPHAELDVPNMISWADTERDLSSWIGNAMQANALHELFKLEISLKESGDPELLSDWRRLSSSDHFYYMCTKYWTDVGRRRNEPFSPYESPYDAYINFMNVLDNIQTRMRN